MSRKRYLQNIHIWLFFVLFRDKRIQLFVLNWNFIRNIGECDRARLAFKLLFLWTETAKSFRKLFGFSVNDGDDDDDMVTIRMMITITTIIEISYLTKRNLIPSVIHKPSAHHHYEAPLLRRRNSKISAPVGWCSCLISEESYSYCGYCRLRKEF